MAISEAYMRGIRVTGFKQFKNGGFAIVGEPFNEVYPGEFLGWVTGHFSYGFTVDANDVVEGMHTICDNEMIEYERRLYSGIRPDAVAAPMRYSGTIADLGGGGLVAGLAIAHKEYDPNAPVTTGLPPCSPLPWVFLLPSGGGPFTVGRGQGVWEGNVFISRG